MVKKVASLLELFATVGVLAFHYSTSPLRTCMFISNDLIENGIRNML
ncbi:MAG: hypothetical protein ACMG6E_10025 [Candidatus Roizmanbacteria bacterium]